MLNQTQITTKIKVQDHVKFADNIYNHSEIKEYLARIILVSTAKPIECNAGYRVDNYSTAIVSINGSSIQDVQYVDYLGELGTKALNVILSKTETMYAFSGLILETDTVHYFHHKGKQIYFRINLDLEFELI